MIIIKEGTFSRWNNESDEKEAHAKKQQPK